VALFLPNADGQEQGHAVSSTVSHYSDSCGAPVIAIDGSLEPPSEGTNRAFAAPKGVVGTKALPLWECPYGPAFRSTFLTTAVALLAYHIFL